MRFLLAQYFAQSDMYTASISANGSYRYKLRGQEGHSCLASFTWNLVSFFLGGELFFKQNQTFCIRCDIQKFSQVVKVQLGSCNLFFLGSEIICCYQKKIQFMYFICKLIYFEGKGKKKDLEADVSANINVCLCFHISS